MLRGTICSSWALAIILAVVCCNSSQGVTDQSLASAVTGEIPPRRLVKRRRLEDKHNAATPGLGSAVFRDPLRRLDKRPTRRLLGGKYGKKKKSDWDDDEDEYDFEYGDEYLSSYSSYSSEENLDKGGPDITCTCYQKNGKDRCPYEYRGYELLDELFNGKDRKFVYIECTDHTLDKLNGTETGYQLPSSIGKLKNLEALELSVHITGELPNELFELPKLKSLVLEAPLLGGQVLSKVTRMPRLEILHLTGSFDGLLPPELGALQRLQDLQISSPLIEGPIPAELGQLSNLWSLQLGGKFQGQLPQSLRALEHLEVLRIRGPPRFLAEDRLGRNGAWGLDEPFPEWIIDALPGLEELVLSNQRLHGELPAHLTSLQRLRELSLEDNLFSGAVPSEFEAELTADLYVFGLGFNQLDGGFPNWVWTHFPMLVDLRMGGNNFRAHSIPDSIGNLSHLENLDLEHSGLTGKIPGTITQCKNLLSLFLGHNSLQGSIPKLPKKVETASLQNNQLVGFAVSLEESSRVDTMVVNVAENPLVCDCSLLGWFGDFFSKKGWREHILEDEGRTTCADVNEYDGSPVLLLRSSGSAPCSHPRGLQAVHVERNLLSLEWGTGTAANPDAKLQVILNRAIAEHRAPLRNGGRNLYSPPSPSSYNNSLCWDCKLVSVAAEDQSLPASAFSSRASVFQISWVDEKTSLALTTCCSLSAMDPSRDGPSARRLFNLTGLETYREYGVSVRMGFAYFDRLYSGKREARLSFGPYSKALLVRTDQGPPTSTPKDLAPAVVQDNMALVQWSPPDSLNGDLVRYKVWVIQLELNHPIEPTALADHPAAAVISSKNESGDGQFVQYVTSNFVRLNSLQPNQRYAVRVSAENSEGPGPFSPLDFVVQTKAACGPGRQKVVLSDETMRCDLCARGFYKSDSQDKDCVPCPESFSVTLAAGASSLDECVTGPGYFKDISKVGQAPASKRCEQGMDCSTAGATSETLDLALGYWRESKTSLLVVPCREEKYCQQTSLVENSYCTANHTGVQCLACDPGFAIKSDDGVCEVCSEDDLSRDTTAVVGWLILLCILVMFGLLRVMHRARKAYYAELAVNELYSSTAALHAAAVLERDRTSLAIVEEQQPQSQAQKVMPSPRDNNSRSSSNSNSSSNNNNKPCYCNGCNEPIADQGFRTLHNTLDGGKSDLFWHNHCLLRSLQNEPLEQCTLQLVKVVHAPVGKEGQHLVAPKIDPCKKEYHHSGSWKVRMHEYASQMSDVLGESISVKVRIFLGFLQVYIAYYIAFQAPALRFTEDFSFIEAIANFDTSALLDVMHVRCAWDYQHYDSLLLYTIIPAGFVLLVCLIYGAVRCLYARFTMAVMSAKTEAWTIVLFIAFMIFPGLSRMIFETFLCEEYPTADGTNVPVHALAADPRVSCDTENRGFWLAYASAMVFVYVFGILAMYGLLLWDIRAICTCDKKELPPDSRHKIERIRFLLKPYTPKAYWFEAYELVRKCLQTIPILFVINSSGSIQVGIFLSQILTFLAIIVLLRLEPYKNPNDGHLAIISQVVLLNACVCALMESFAAFDIVHFNGFNFGALVAAAFVFEIIAFLGLCAVDLCKALKQRRQAQNEPPQSRPTVQSMLDDDDDDEDENSTLQNTNPEQAPALATPQPLLVTTTFEQSQARKQVLSINTDERSPERTGSSGSLLSPGVLANV